MLSVTPEIRAHLEREISRRDRAVRFSVSGDVAARRDQDEKRDPLGGGRVCLDRKPAVKSGGFAVGEDSVEERR